jgi:hypothetical protein
MRPLLLASASSNGSASVIGMNKNKQETVGYLKRDTEGIVLGPHPIGITLQLKITIEWIFCVCH